MIVAARLGKKSQGYADLNPFCASMVESKNASIDAGVLVLNAISPVPNMRY
jgi:hypothetical protein